MSSSFSNSRVVAFMVWIVASIFYAYQYILRVMPNIMLDDIMDQFGISAATFGQFSGVYYLGYSLLHLPVGILLDRFGPKKVMSSCIFLTVLGLTPLLLAHHWAFPIAGRFLIGIGSSAAILGVFKIIRMIFSEKNFPRMLSLSVTIGLVGAIYGGAPISYMREMMGYDAVLQLLAAAGILLAIGTYWIIPNILASSKTTVLSDIKEVLGNKKVIWSCIFAGLMVGPLEGFADVWGTVFLKQVYGFDSTTAASLPSMIFIGMCFGAPVLSFIAEKVGSYLLTIIGSGLVMASCFALLLVWPLSPALLSISFAIVGVCCAYQILTIYKASTYTRQEVAGLTTAVANMIIMIFGYAFHSVIGSVVNMLGGINVKDALFYGVAVIPIALSFGVAGFFLALFWEKNPTKALAKQTLTTQQNKESQ